MSGDHGYDPFGLAEPNPAMEAAVAEIDELRAELARLRAENERLTRELADEQHDLGVICEEVSIVYDAVTFGRFSKPNTAAEHIIAAVEERTAQQIEDAEEPLKVEIGELQAENERLRAALRPFADLYESTKDLHDRAAPRYVYLEDLYRAAAALKDEP